MINTLQGIRDRIKTSLYGRRLGLDNTECIVGANDIIKPVETISSTAASQTLSSYGASLITATNASTNAALTFNLPAPIPGVQKVISQLSTSTAGYAVVLASGVFVTSGSSALTTFTFTASNQHLNLFGQSTGAYMVLSQQSTMLVGS